jgi:hypothetical protein
MRAQLTRVLLILCLGLGFGFGLVGVTSSRAVAAGKKKKKHHKTHHKSANPAGASSASGSANSAKTGGAAPAEEDDEEGGEEAESDDKADDAKAKPKVKAKVSKDSDDKASEDGEREADRKGGGDDDEGNGDTVVRRKAKPVAMESGGGGPVGLELQAGPGILHRSFSFNDPLSDHAAPGAVTPPYSYGLPAGPTPFLDLAFYPAAFATRGFAANLGIVGHYERLVGTKTAGTDFSTLAQQFDVGVRARLPLGENELGLTASYGKQTFHVTESDPGPAPPNGSNIPNVDYTFGAIEADGRLQLSPIELRAHVGTRLMTNTGSLGEKWFSTIKTTAITAGFSVAYPLTSIFAVVVGGDIVRYAFDFNPVPTTNIVVAGGAVDQYLSGFLALRVTLSGG